MDRFEDLRTFVRVSELSSVSKAAAELQRAPSAVSRRLSELEARLGSQLLTRTTRQIVLTDAGERFLVRAQQILADLEEAEECVGEDVQSLTGTLRLTAPLSFGLKHLTPAITGFLKANPDLQIDMDLNDQHRDLISNRLDLAIRIGTLHDSSLKSRLLAPINQIVAAAPSFWKEHGKPAFAAELSRYPGLCYSNLASPGRWSYTDASGKPGLVDIHSIRMLANNGDVLLSSAIDGLGILLEPTFLMNDAILNGSLEPVLMDHHWGRHGLHAVYPDTRFLPARTRAFIDYLVNNFGDTPLWDECLKP
ncbi:LysR family transcriptional regulator [Granulosicoccus antarcticus]|uniref:HTH-type transcriptional regulator DmlR n=1 Tax=Granulosicoccus antarcticus IMCC3135 TaxID=1192854 RepID=A0A2Z2NUQ0_9GAMM|nr:LysR family transcriptional regulator [Granulosicoccus antarcticus]ASJ75292.1 HTH-type transcriptional regulator DmlR [Granulosicoccus antarcticus IMCC3135]